jgi:hypothetical protein
MIPQNDRDARGRFTPGNRASCAGGAARAAKLSKRRRSAIARQGFQAMVDKWFHGDAHAARRRWAAVGVYNSERVFEGTPIPVRAQHPGTISEFCERHWQPSLLDGQHRDVDF